MNLANSTLEILNMSNAKIIALVLIVFACGTISGIITLLFIGGTGTTSGQYESVGLTNQHLWGGNNWTEAALVVINNGTQKTVFKKVTVLGNVCKWNDIFYWKTDTGPVASPLEPSPTHLSGTSVQIVVDGLERTFQQATGELTLDPLWTVVLYIKNPIVIEIAQVPVAVTITVFTENHMYFVAASNDITFPFMKTEELKIISATFNSGPPKTAVLSVTNTGANSLTVSSLTVDDVSYTPTYGGSFGSDHSLAKGASGTLTITWNWTSGYKYTFGVLTTTGNKYTYTTTAAP
jgi:hypothetical protein